MPTVVHVVDDDASFRTAVGRLLRASGYEVVEYKSAQQLLERLPAAAGPSCILLDVRMPGVSGPELQDRLAKQGSPLPIVFLTGHGNIPMSVQAMRAGAADFLTKPVPRVKLLGAIERAIAHYNETSDERERLNTWRRLVGTLTPRERQIFELVAHGKMNKQIAHELGTTERTVKAHRHRVMEKIRVQSLAELVSLAERIGIMDLGAPADGEPKRGQ